MPTIGQKFSSFIKVPKWRKPKKKPEKKERPRSLLDVTDIIRNIEGLETSYQSFDLDTNEIPTIITDLQNRPKSSKQHKSGTKRSLMSLMCGMNSTDIDIENKSQPLSPKTSTPEKRKSWMTFMCGIENMDFDIQNENLPVRGEETRRSWISFVSGIKNKSKLSSPCRDSGISILSEEKENQLSVQTTHLQSRSCDDIIENICEPEDDSPAADSFVCGSQSMNNLFRTTSIQENAFKITHRRRQNIKRRRGNECYSCCSEIDIRPILKGSKSEGDLLNMDSISEKEVRFSVCEDGLQGKSVSTADVNRYQSRQLKSWQIRRQNRDQRNKLKRESRNLELLQSKDFEFQERLIV